MHRWTGTACSRFTRPEKAARAVHDVARALHDAAGFAIDRLETALKNRPGRISQCVHFGPPPADLRRKYLENFLGKHYEPSLDLDTVVKRTEGASQAFLKELVQRALQFAVDGGRSNGDRLMVELGDFTAGLKEMTAFDEKAVRGITGFRV